MKRIVRSFFIAMFSSAAASCFTLAAIQSNSKQIVPGLFLEALCIIAIFQKNKG